MLFNNKSVPETSLRGVWGDEALVAAVHNAEAETQHAVIPMYTYRCTLKYLCRQGGQLPTTAYERLAQTPCFVQDASALLGHAG